jgi:AraC-like DNA-binding protein
MPREQTKLWQLTTHFGNIRLLRATYLTQAFARHSHEDFPIGVIEQGALEFSYRGANVVAPVGSINLANPGEPHTGQAATENGWTYRMFYVDLSLLQQVAAEIAGQPQDLPFFQAGVLHDAELAQQIRTVHTALEQPGLSALEQESRVWEMLTRVILRYADSHPVLRPFGRESRAVRRVREYLEAHYAENIALAQLAQIANLSPFHLAHVFQTEIGLPPHVYLTQIRIQRAQVLLAKGWPITEAAFEVGFFDQSHFHKRFKRIVGMTPAQYRKNVQDK